MPDPRRMIVEEIGNEEPKENAQEPVLTTTDEIKEKVEELQDLTEHITEDVKESAEIQDEIKEKVEISEEILPNQAPTFNPIIIILPGLLLLGALLGGIIFYQKSINSQNSEVVPSPSPNEQVTPTSTPLASPAASLSKYSINIMNGSGISGEAGKAKTLVEGAGFKVGKTGNASTYDFTKTIIKAKTTVEKDYLDALNKALGKNYTVDSAVQSLSSSSSDDVQIILGSLKSK